MNDTTSLIKRLRATGLSQSAIARMTGIPQPRISRWENGEAPTGADDVLKLLALEAELATKPAPTTEPAAAGG